MTKEEYDKLQDIVKDKQWFAYKSLVSFLDTVEISETPKGQRTSAQNRALHLAFTHLADVLNDAGLSMRVLLKPEVDIPWTQYTIKEHLFKPFMKIMTGKESTKELSKTGGDIEKVWDTLMRELGERHGIEHVPFPSNEAIHMRLQAMENLTSTNYPQYTGGTAFD